MVKKIKKILPFATKRRLHQEKITSNKYLEDNKVGAKVRSGLYEELNKKNNATIDQENNVHVEVNPQDDDTPQATSSQSTAEQLKTGKETLETDLTSGENTAEQTNDIDTKQKEKEKEQQLDNTPSPSSSIRRQRNWSSATAVDFNSKETNDSDDDYESKDELFDDVEEQDKGKQKQVSLPQPISSKVEVELSEKTDVNWENTPTPSTVNKKFDCEKTIEQTNQTTWTDYLNKLPNPSYHLKKHAGKYITGITGFAVGFGVGNAYNSSADTKNAANLSVDPTNCNSAKNICLLTDFPLNHGNNNPEVNGFTEWYPNNHQEKTNQEIESNQIEEEFFDAEENQENSENSQSEPNLIVPDNSQPILQAEINAKDSQIEKLTKQRASFHQQAQSRESQAANLVNKNRSLRKEKELIDDNLTATKIQLITANQQIQDLNDTINKLNNQKDKAESDLTTAQQTIQNLSEEAKVLNQQLNQKETNQQANQAKIIDKLAQANEKLRKDQQQFAKKEAAFAAQAAQEKQAKKAQDKAQQALALKEKELTEAKVAKEKAEKEARESAIQSKQEFEQQKSSYQTIIQNLEIAKNKKDREVDHLAEKLAELEKKQPAEEEQDQINELKSILAEKNQVIRDSQISSWIRTVGESGVAAYLVYQQWMSEKLDTEQVEQELDNWKSQAEQEKKRADDLQNQLDNHTCSAPCSHDYPRDNYQGLESKIIQQINQNYHLGLNNPSLKETIQRIQQLISKPPKEIYQEFNNSDLQRELKQANQTIINLEKELANQDTPFGENLETIKEIDLKDLEKELGIQLSPETVKQIQQATNYQQLATARNAEIKKHLQQNLNSLAVVNPPKEIIQPVKQERIIWLGLLLTALLTIGGLMVKMAKSKKRN